MEKADQIVKGMRAMVGESNSDSLPNVVTVDKEEMIRHLDEIETTMNQSLQVMRNFVEDSKRLPLTNKIMIDPTELINLGEGLKTVLLKQVFRIIEIIDDLTGTSELLRESVLKKSLGMYKEEIEAGRWDEELQRMMRSIVRLYGGDTAEERGYWKQQLKDLEEKVWIRDKQ